MTRTEIEKMFTDTLSTFYYSDELLEYGEKEQAQHVYWQYMGKIKMIEMLGLFDEYCAWKRR